MKLLLFLCLLVGIHSNSYPYEPYHQVIRNQNQRGKENRNMPEQAVGNRVCQFACCFYKEISSHENFTLIHVRFLKMKSMKVIVNSYK